MRQTSVLRVMAGWIVLAMVAAGCGTLTGTAIGVGRQWGPGRATPAVSSNAHGVGDAGHRLSHRLFISRGVQYGCRWSGIRRQYVQRTPRRACIEA